MNELTIPRYLKMMIISLGVMLGIGLFSTVTWAEGVEISGDFSTYLTFDTQNEDSLIADPVTHRDLSGLIVGNLTIQSRDENQFQYYLNLSINGSLVNFGTEVPPLGISPNQLYIMVPFSDIFYLYCGRKIKEIGVSNNFNISNRISPKFLSNYAYSRNAPGLIEGDLIVSDIATYGFMVNFQDAQNWHDIQSSLFVNTRFDNFSLDGYLYYDALKDSMLGLDMTYQMGIVQFYLESIYKKKAEQKVLDGTVFITRDLKDAFGVVVGGSVSVNKFIGSLEYFYSNEGLTAAEQKDFIDHIDTFAGTLDQKKALISSNYSRGAFVKNYLAVNLSQGSLFNHNDLSGGLSLLASYQPGSGTDDYTSYEYNLNFSYILQQNLKFTLYQIGRTGGAKGEFNRLNLDNSSSALLLTYNF